MSEWNPFCPTHRIRRDATPFVIEYVCLLGRHGYTREEWPNGTPSYRVHAGKHRIWTWRGHTFAGSVESLTAHSTPEDD